MSILQAYHGVVRKGRIHITPPAKLPEGSEVYVVVTGEMKGQTAVPGSAETVLADTAVAVDTAVIREEAAFYRMHADLWQKYPGEYVAVYHEEMIDHDHDQVALYLRVKARYPEQFVWIAPVRETAVPDTLYTSPNHAAMEQEQAAFQRMLPDLLHHYKSQYVAIYRGEVIDHDLDQTALVVRLDQTHPDDVVLVKLVTDKPDRLLRMPSPRLMRDE